MDMPPGLGNGRWKILIRILLSDYKSMGLREMNSVDSFEDTSPLTSTLHLRKLSTLVCLSCLTNSSLILYRIQI